MSVTIYIKKGHEYIWKIARAYAKTHNMHLSDLVVKALTEFILKNP